LISNEEESLVCSIVFFWEFDFGYVTETGKSALYFLLGEFVRDVCDVESVGVDL
jgi:hypothetical protein